MREEVLFRVFRTVTCHQEGRAEVQQLVCEMRAEGERHRRELDAVRQQCRRDVEDAHRQGLSQCKSHRVDVNKKFQEIHHSYMCK